MFGPRGRQVALEPRQGEAGHLLERARLLEEVAGAGDDHHFLGGGNAGEGLLVEADHGGVHLTHQQERRGLHRVQGLARQVRPAAAPVLAPK